MTQPTSYHEFTEAVREFVDIARAQGWPDERIVARLEAVFEVHMMKMSDGRWVKLARGVH